MFTVIPCAKIGTYLLSMHIAHIMPLVRLSSCTLDRLDCMTLNCLHTYTCATYFPKSCISVNSNAHIIHNET